jgi:hypothetical protein
LDGDAHIASVAEGDRSEAPRRDSHTDRDPTFVPRADATKHQPSTKVKPGGAR